LDTIEKAKLIYGKETDSDKLAFAIKRATDDICGYCNIEVIDDDALDDICAELAADIYERQAEGEKLKSITEGDLAMTFSDENDYGFEKIRSYRQRLEKFRRLKWS